MNQSMNAAVEGSLRACFEAVRKLEDGYEKEHAAIHRIMSIRAKVEFR